MEAGGGRAHSQVLSEKNPPCLPTVFYRRTVARSSYPAAVRRAARRGCRSVSINNTLFLFRRKIFTPKQVAVAWRSNLRGVGVGGEDVRILII